MPITDVTASGREAQTRSQLPAPWEIRPAHSPWPGAGAFSSVADCCILGRIVFEAVEASQGRPGGAIENGLFGLLLQFALLLATLTLFGGLLLCAREERWFRWH